MISRNRIEFRQGLVFLVAVLLAAGGGWYAHKWYHCHYGKHDARRVKLNGYEFTSPLLDIELPEGINIDQEPHPFKYKIESMIRSRIAKGEVHDVAVYYRDLQNGPWFGINEKTEFNPASMMKVPVMVAWLKRAEKDRSLLKRRMRFEAAKNPVPSQHVVPAKTLSSGQSYTIEELLHYMMSYSDNRATALLYKALTDAEIGDVLDSMDVNNDPHDNVNATNIHGYSGFFRILYNASYLNREMSEKALQLLSLQDFALGISAGVPPGVKVAAKFGEIVPENPGEDSQLHEFGIVYHARRPYILGIMTKGHDFAKQVSIIREISRMVYAEVDAQ